MMGEGEKGFCGVRWNDGRLQSLSTSDSGLLHAYLDPHVTNCCGAWFCPGGTGAGYPEFCYSSNTERGYQNLSVFFYGCNFNCLYCQNSSHKDLNAGTRMTVDEFAGIVAGNPRVSCICFFGGSPEPQLPFAINASKKAIEACKERILRICFEWNGCGDTGLVKEAAQLSLSSGGNIKFDLKCFTPSLSMALSGVKNERAYANFRTIGEEFFPLRPGLPVLTATTLMVSGYVDSHEVDRIAEFIGEINPSIPYSLLVFHPDYRMMDLPITPVSQAVDCYNAAARHLENVNVGNLHSIGVRNMNEFKALARKAA
ncbi:MAG: radical SAM protein [Candidatus Bathyarchaeota archaeon]|nr:radical SAM protein [Candidatus Bathyarchaeota archaeon]